MDYCDSDRRFGGLARLYGRAALQRFKDAHVCVIGIGGVGSWAVEALARSAIGKLTLIDMDHVAESNINRQLPAMTENLGKSKIVVMADRCMAINPDCEVQLIDDYIEAQNLPEYISNQFDYVIDCIDNFRTKAALADYCKQQHIALIMIGGAGGRIDPTCIKNTDLSRSEQDPLLAKTRALLRQDYGFSRNPKKKFGIDSVWSEEQMRYPTADGGTSLQKPATRNTSSLNCGGLGSSMPVTSSFAQIAVAHVLRKLSNGT